MKKKNNGVVEAGRRGSAQGAFDPMKAIDAKHLVPGQSSAGASFASLSSDTRRSVILDQLAVRER